METPYGNKYNVFGTISSENIEVISEICKDTKRGSGLLKNFELIEDDTGPEEMAEHVSKIREAQVDKFFSKEEVLFEATLTETELNKLKSGKNQLESILDLFNENKENELKIFKTPHAKRLLFVIAGVLNKEFDENFKLRSFFAAKRFGL
jgi:hypothetical protein